ncbi:MAG: 23S rRNA (adenine(2503)-C(2))-methyltransferase RlmN [Lachnospiraceae bacterium]|nr:23S rRNA (adenine(2503)-C(2))-methyltransferase RlmN [Lachnospiraceae bacterium]
MIDIKSQNLIELTEFIGSQGEKPFRAKQIFEWIHEKHAGDFDCMTNISIPLREKLKQSAYISGIKIAQELISKEDGTRKYLLELDDGNIIESVLMRYEYGLSVCISSQVGCRMGCKFCASTIDGLVRNLTAGEMLDEIYCIQEHIGERISHVVIMGSGEPLDNYDNFIKFVELTDIGHRNITVSTCGIVPRIYELADLKNQVTLAVSLHAPNDELRKTIMPVANAYSISQLTDACKYYISVTGRRITFEYSLIAGVNDNEKCAAELSEIAKQLGAHINLIPVNPVEEREFRQPYIKTINAFKSKLERCGINVTIRREMGRDISGACGQLRRHYKGNT